MAILIGSARIDERGNISGGSLGDQKQTSTPDYRGEVSQENFYVHPLGWTILRAKDTTVANKLAESMIRACNNPNIGYDQGNRTGVIKYGTASTVKTECDCSALVRQCIIEASGKDPGNFTTATEAVMVMKTGIFDKLNYKSGTELYTGDILVTSSRGHTVIVTSGCSRGSVAPIPAAGGCYPKYTGSSTSIATALKSLGVDSSYDNRAKIAAANGIANYSGSGAQNTQMLTLLKQGKLVKAGALASVAYYPRYTGSSSSITTALKDVGEKDTTFSHRSKIASANGITGYAGLASQNLKLVELLKKGVLKKA